MHTKIKDIDKFLAIKAEACCALCESLNNKAFPTMGHWEKISDLYISWCLQYLSFLFSVIWANLHIFGTAAQIPTSFRTRFLFKQYLNNFCCAKEKSPWFSNYFLLFLVNSNPSNISNSERYQLSEFVLLDLSWYLGIWLSSSSNQDDN